MDAELKEHLESMEGRLRADIVILEDRIMQRVDGRLDAVELRMTDAIAKADHELETKLIAEFWKMGTHVRPPHAAKHGYRKAGHGDARHHEPKADERRRSDHGTRAKETTCGVSQSTFQ